MFDYQDYYNKLHEKLQKREPLWQAIIVKTDGSTPAKPGMHLAVALDSNPIGNLGGGNLEYTVIEMIRNRQPDKSELWKFDLDEQGMPLASQKEHPSSSPAPEYPDAVQEIHQTAMICGGKVEVFIEPLFPSSSLYIIGGGHCGKALAHLAELVNFRVTVIDNRKELLIKDDFPKSCLLVYNDYNNIETAVKFTPASYIVIMTHGHIHDKQVLECCLRKPFFYLGMIGSQKKVAETFANLRKQGFTEDELQKVHAPVGLSIGSQTPFEIAVSITAELIKKRNKSKTVQPEQQPNQ